MKKNSLLSSLSFVSKADFKILVLDALSFAFIWAFISHWYTRPTEAQLNSLAFLALRGLGLLLVGGFVSTAAFRKKWKTVGRLVFEPRHVSRRPSQWYRELWGWQLLILFLTAFATGVLVTEASLTELFSDEGFAGAQRIFSSLASPDFSILAKALLAIFQTVFIAFMATILALPVAFVLSFVCAKNIMGSNRLTFGLYVLLRGVMNAIRSIEPLIWAIIFSVWVGIGPFAGMLSLFLHSIVSLAKQYSEIIEGVDEGPIEGILSTGASPIQVIWFAIVPQVILPFVSFTIYRWDINVRMATIIGLVGGGGIGTMLIQYQGQGLWHEVGCLVLVIAIVVWAMDTASAYLRAALK